MKQISGYILQFYLSIILTPRNFFIFFNGHFELIFCIVVEQKTECNASCKQSLEYLNKCKKIFSEKQKNNEIR